MDERIKQKERLKLILRDSGISVTRFAKEIGVKYPTLSGAMHNPRVGISSRLAVAICDRFNYSYNWLVYGIGEMKANGHSEEKMTNEQLLELINKLKEQIDEDANIIAQLKSDNQLWRDMVITQNLIIKDKLNLK